MVRTSDGKRIQYFKQSQIFTTLFTTKQMVSKKFRVRDHWTPLRWKKTIINFGWARTQLVAVKIIPLVQNTTLLKQKPRGENIVPYFCLDAGKVSRTQNNLSLFVTLPFASLHISTLEGYELSLSQWNRNFQLVVLMLYSDGLKQKVTTNNSLRRKKKISAGSWDYERQTPSNK